MESKISSLVMMLGIEDRINDMYVKVVYNEQTNGYIFNYRSAVYVDIPENWHTLYANNGNETRAIKDITNIWFDKIIII